MDFAKSARQRGAVDFITLALCVAFAVAVWLFYSWAYGRGHQVAISAAEKTAAVQKAADKIEEARQADAARTTEGQLRKEAETLTAQLRESQDHATNLQTRLDRSLRAGTERLSVRATSCTISAVPTGGAAQPAGAGPQETRAELHPADAADIAAITAEADDTARQLNYCIDRYDSAAQAMERYTNTLKARHVEAAKPAHPD